MLLADFADKLAPIAALIVTTVFVGLIIFIVVGQRRFVAAAERAQMRAYEGTTWSRAPAPGMVLVVFHTYSGILVFTRQINHRFWAPSPDARLILSRLHRFNLSWGFFAYGALIIPILSLGNYWAQCSSIKKQTRPPTP